MAGEVDGGLDPHGAVGGRVLTTSPTSRHEVVLVADGAAGCHVQLLEVGEVAVAGADGGNGGSPAWAHRFEERARPHGPFEMDVEMGFR